ncbi:hypothetical protein YC2023_082472 [Brassica napus]
MVLSEPINVLVEVAVTVTSGEENGGEDDVLEDKELESVVEGDKDGDEEDDDDEEEKMCRTRNYVIGRYTIGNTIITWKNYLVLLG